MDSKILDNSQDKKNIIKEFISPNKKVQSELKYRLTRDGADFNTFHRLCDNISKIIFLEDLLKFLGKKEIAKKMILKVFCSQLIKIKNINQNIMNTIIYIAIQIMALGFGVEILDSKIMI